MKTFIYIYNIILNITKKNKVFVVIYFYNHFFFIINILLLSLNTVYYIT